MFADSGRTDLLALESYDRILIETGNHIYKLRSEFIFEFQPIFQRIYKQLSNDAELTKLTYMSGIHACEMDEGLKKSRQKDLILQRTSFGIHRDDYEFGLEGGEMKRLGSQGQQKSFVIALKLAQFEILKTRKGKAPILLLDDIFDKLDDLRIGQLLSLMDGFGQLFLTDARPHRTQELLTGLIRPAQIFEVDNGKVKPK
jgi:DNA replication and repair protein RecF